jgi:predicted Rossmann fold flavoprotein
VQVDIAIVGGGAAGLTAAIFAGRTGKGLRIVLLDGAPKIGAKILISGGGRCNVTHDVVTPEDFNGNRNAIAKVLRTFPVSDTIAFFEDLGVELKREEGGKLFPVTNKARTVLDALLAGARDAGVEIVTATRVEKIDPGFVINGDIHARRVILATGGRSVPKTGSDGHGYVLARSLGHTVTETFPALVPLRIEPPHWILELSGTSADVELTVRSNAGGIVARQRGAMLFTHFGISGPAALDISRHWIHERGKLVANFLPGGTFESLEQRLLAAAKKNPHATVASTLRGSVPERVLDRLAPAVPIGKLPRQERRAAIHALVDQVIPVSRDRGFDYAEVTAGGVPLSEVDLGTMASRRCDGLYLCGEILDVDGRIGGYNFQWAWASGRLAGLHCPELA